MPLSSKLSGTSVPAVFKRSSLSLALVAVMAASAMSMAAEPLEPSDEMTFDVQVLKARGIDPKVAEWFRHAPRFLPGEATVVLTVNGSARGRTTVQIGQDGQVCVDATFLKAAGLITPPEFSEHASCFDLKTAWPQTEWLLDPGAGRVELVLPAQAVAAPGIESGNWTRGGFAGMLNYDASYMDSGGAAAGVKYMQMNTEAGFNLSDWIVRSRQTFSRLDGQDRVQHQAAYAQRSFTDIKQVLQTGQISLSNSLFGTGQVFGLQVFPEAALQSGKGGAGLVEGLADSQSVVEVRQSGALVYSTTVPAGPFRLEGFPLLNTRSDLNVTVTDSSGTKREFVVPASTLLMNGAAVAPGLSFGVGKLDQEGSSESPIIGTVANGWVLNPRTTLSAGLLGSTPYRAGALGLDTQLSGATTLSVQARTAQDNRHGTKGLSATASLSQRLSERVGVSLNVSQQTFGYSELSDALQEDQTLTDGRSRQQVGAGINWSQQALGNLSFSWARGSAFDGSSTQYLRGNWSKSFGKVYVGASVEYDGGRQGQDVNGLSSDGDKRIYLTVNIPFGESRSVSSYANNSNRGSRAGMRYSDRSIQDFGWGVSTDRDFESRRTSTTASMDMATSVSQLSASVSSDSNNFKSWSGRASGGVVVHDGGVTLSSRRVSDTFGIAKVGNEGGVRVDTPGGTTWTDRRGYAVLPSLSSYKQSSIQVDTRSLPKNVDIANAWQDTEAARGSVSYVNFDVVRTRRVLVTVLDRQHQPLPRGASVFDAKDTFVTVVGDDGTVFVPDAEADVDYEVQSSGHKLCTFTLQLPEEAQSSELYETADAVCR